MYRVEGQAYYCETFGVLQQWDALATRDRLECEPGGETTTSQQPSRVAWRKKLVDKTGTSDRSCRPAGTRKEDAATIVRPS